MHDQMVVISQDVAIAIGVEKPGNSVSNGLRGRVSQLIIDSAGGVDEDPPHWEAATRDINLPNHQASSGM